MSVMRIRFRKLGGHYHCRVFTAPAPNMTYAKNGDLVFDEHEWEDVQRMLPGVDFKEEDAVCPLCGASAVRSDKYTDCTKCGWRAS